MHEECHLKYAQFVASTTARPGPVAQKHPGL